MAAAPSAAAQTGCIVTIGRSYGAGGRSIGKLVAEELHIPYYDAELLEKAAQSHGLSEKVLRNMDEKPLHSAMIYRSVGLGTPGYDDLATLATRSQVEVIECVAEEGPCVIVGRLADQVLRGRYDLLSVFITASEESRIQHVMQREGLSHEEAARQMRKVEKERAAFYNQRSATRWGAAEGYDLCVNTDWYGPEKAAHLIASLAREQTPTAGKTK